MDAAAPPIHAYFDAGMLPPGYHYIDYSRVLTSAELASLPPQQLVADERQRQLAPPPPQQQQQQQQQWLEQQFQQQPQHKQRLEKQWQQLEQQRARSSKSRMKPFGSTALAAGGANGQFPCQYISASLKLSAERRADDFSESTC